MILDLLKCYVNEADKHNQWEKYLPLVQYAYNNIEHSSTGKSPFEVIEGKPKPPLMLKMKHNIFATDECVRDIQESIQKVKGSSIYFAAQAKEGYRQAWKAFGIQY